MSDKNDGGKRFLLPRTKEITTYSKQIKGMTLRDYFAAKAMQGILAAQIHGFNDQPANGPFADMAYKMADAMLKARIE